MKKYWIPALRIKIFFIFVLGIIYPLLMTKVSQVIFPDNANGSIIVIKGKKIGSNWIGQKFTSLGYFWPRPSAVDYQPLPSGGSNFGQASEALKKAVEERKIMLQKAHQDLGEPPQDLLFSSASGVDPHISLEAATYQMNRVARARAMEVGKVECLIALATKGPQFGVFGETTVNVLELNILLDKAQGKL